MCVKAKSYLEGMNIIVSKRDIRRTRGLKQQIEKNLAE